MTVHFVVFPYGTGTQTHTRSGPSYTEPFRTDPGSTQTSVDGVPSELGPSEDVDVDTLELEYWFTVT